MSRHRPWPGSSFFRGCSPIATAQGPFDEEIPIHTYDGSAFVGLNIWLQAWRAADVAGKVDLVRATIVDPLARIRPKRLFDANRARLLDVVEAAVEPAVMAVRREFPNVA